VNAHPPLGTPVAVTLLTDALPTGSRTGTETFYSALLGWTFGDEPGDDSPRDLPGDVADGAAGRRRLIRVGDDVVATVRSAVAGRAPGQPLTGWVVSLLGPTDAADRITRAGGRVLAEADGTLYVADPAGAAFAVTPTLPDAAPAAPVAPGTGRPVWFENMTTDAAAADGFYAGVFGLRPQPTPDAPHYRLLLADGRPVAGRLALPPDLAEHLGPRWMTYLAHPRVDDAAAQAADLGGTVLVPPRDTPTGRVSTLADPGGAVVTLLTTA